MGKYDTQQVCLNGHQVTSMYHESPAHREAFCNTCGERTIHKCPKCDAEIRGYYDADGVVLLGFGTPVPEHCHSCGAPYPWTERKKNLSKALSESSSTDPLHLVIQICSRFHLVAKQLRSRHAGRATLDIEDEYDVQDLIHTLLRLFFDDIRPEEVCPSYAGSSSRMDFLLKDESIVVEIKKTRAGLGAKEVGNQLIEDIARYQSHPSCKTLVCFVYDPEGRVANPRGLENDLNRTEDDLVVKVIIVPKGY